ncbi:hypothetical protein AYL99_03892 [Fonsecaea erecta]|uniref:Uncharacterized protein n=1 Tax=Fonsecaea erecta TaxID=1367422 RepID=A0A178ZPF1_9EURO|nr:hypothetical protein AYL99_03892 [Fonsecaea erecta]OAP61689.1 hypothetical protein AYL99_03892 [Fonsecaea erecta]
MYVTRSVRRELRFGLRISSARAFLQASFQETRVQLSSHLSTPGMERIGWGVLCVAGGGAYYFAKKSINADRAARFEAEQQKKARFQRLEDSHIAFNKQPPTSKLKTKAKEQNVSLNNKGLDHAGSPSSEISEDAAPVGHAPVDGEQRVREKSKYEAAEPYRSKKGDRLS